MLTPLIPVALLFAAGALFRRFKGDLSVPLVEAVIFVIFPAFVFKTVWGLELGAEVVRVSVLALFSVALGGLLGWIAGQLFHTSRGTTATFMLLGALGNTSFLGFPFINAYWGEAGLSHAVIFDQIATMPMLVIYGTIVAAWGSGTSVNARQVLWRIVAFPPFGALVAGLLLNGTPLPQPLIDSLDLIGAALLPVILLAVGMKFTLSSLHGNIRNLSIVLGIKMVVLPLGVAGIALFWGGWDLSAQVSILEAAMPPMVLACVLAIRQKLDENLAVASLGFGMLLSFVIVPLFYTLIT
jgi:predicted permease